MRNKICFIVPYYGKFPPYFSLFIESVAGKSFDIFLFTDLQKPLSMPSNVVWHHFPFEEIPKLIKSKFKVEITLLSPYKLCDFKPMYGLLFNEYITEYNFWGSIDIDTLVGNFSHFISDNLLDGIDFYSGIEEYISGSLFLVRNNSYCNSIFKNSRDWQHVLRTEKYLGFDECGGPYFKELKQGKSIFEIQSQIQSFTEIILLEEKKGLRTLFANAILEPRGKDSVPINEQGISYKDKEYLMLHYIYFKTRYYFIMNKRNVKHPFFITSLGVFRKKPTLFRLMFSSNLISATREKIAINIRKLKI